MGPSDPHPNWHLGMRGSQHRAVMWRVWKEGGTGFLYWGANCYEKASISSAEVVFAICAYYCLAENTIYMSPLTFTFTFTFFKAMHVSIRLSRLGSGVASPLVMGSCFTPVRFSHILISQLLQLD